MRVTRTVVLLFICLASCAFAQDPESVVTIRPIAPAEPLKVGQPSSVAIELTIVSPYHINSDKPLEDYLIPTTLELEPITGVTFGKAIYPPAQRKKLPISDKPMAVWEGIIKITVEVIPDSSVRQKEIVLKGAVRYQACDDTTCLRPVKKEFSVSLSVEGAPASLPGSAETSAPQKASFAGTQLPAAETFGDQGILITLLLVFLGGLALNLTPCVYPMIPITISYFGGQAQGKKGSLIAHASLYVVGMAVTYSILGVFAAMTGNLFGTALQYPTVLVGIAIIMVLLALSMFDVYEFRMPAFLNRLAGGSQKGFAGTFLMGLTIGIVAAPCVGPFVLGLLTYVGNKGNAVLGFILFFILALGMGIPFIVLGAFSGSIQRLPRSGAWMVWVRKIFGFILIAMAVYFLEPLFPNPLIYGLTFALIMFLAGVYLAWIDSVPSTGKALLFVRNLVGIVFWSVALYAAATGIKDYIKEAKTIASGPIATMEIQWLPYSESIMSRAQAEAKPVFIDFFADWCIPCKELDIRTFAAPEVVSRAKDFIMVKVDLTSTGDPQSEALRQKYDVKALPALVFLRPDGQEISELRGTGFESKEVFLGKMNRALQP